MTDLPRRHWRKRLPGFGMSRRQATLRNSQRTRMNLEALEARWVPSTVTNLNDAGLGSLRQAIIDTPAGGTVDFQSGLTGTIMLTSGELAITHDLTVAGPGADRITVSGNHHSRVFEIPSAQIRVTISALTVADGFVSGNVAYGGGIFNDGTLTVTDCTVSGNHVEADIVGGEGAGITNTGTLTIINCTISGNSASTGEGGGIWNAYGTVSLIDSTISGNSALLYAGGGIFQYTGGAGATLIMSNSSVSGNSAGTLGGGIFLSDGTLSVSNSTVSGNSAGGEGGGVWGNGYAARTIRNTIIAGNTALNAPDMAGSLGSQGHNLIGDGTGGSGYDPTDLVGTAANPIDPLLGPLADNGGPTQTMAELPGSPAIGSGDITNAAMWDQRGPGFPRVVNGKIDIGAFEVQAVAPTVTCTVADSLLWPPNHQLVNVGLSVTVDPPDANLQIMVYANDNASPADAADIGPGTLQLRAERQGNGDGRVYLIVVTAANAGGSSFDVCSVAVPHDHSPDSIAAAQHQAAAAGAYYRENQTAPPGYALLGEGPDGGGDAPAPAQSGKHAIRGDTFRFASALPATSQSPLGPASVTAAALRPADEMRAAWAALSADSYFATASDEAFPFLVARPAPAWQEAVTGAALDLSPGDDRLLV